MPRKKIRKAKKKFSDWLYAVPIILGTIGSLVGYFYLKPRDKEGAKNMLIVGIASNLFTPVGGLIAYLLYYRKPK